MWVSVVRSLVRYFRIEFEVLVAVVSHMLRLLLNGRVSQLQTRLFQLVISDSIDGTFAPPRRDMMCSEKNEQGRI